MSHVAVKTADLAGTVRFYEQVVGLRLAERPPFEFPGAWMADAGGNAIVHLYAGKPGRGPRGQVFVGSAAVDHFSFNATGFAAYRRKLEALGMDYREQPVPATALWQLFFYDPNGVMVELVFDGTVEEGPAPLQTSPRLYQPGVSFYTPAQAARRPKRADRPAAPRKRHPAATRAGAAPRGAAHRAR
jgi:catechol 2,3-dioxygenase-like lactoylglutathione lyase family enzyme